jgi:hypothetical protein
MAMLGLWGCGGGSSADLAFSGGTSGSGVVGGTSGSGVTGGTLNGFGSIVVNGTSYLTSADDAAIGTELVGPAPGFDEADLAPGMLVQVDWRQPRPDAPREAIRVSYLPELRGPVTGALVARSSGAPARLTVAGRTVELSPTTVVADPYAHANAGVTPIASVADLLPGVDRVEVSGFLVPAAADDATLVRASRIARVGQNGAADPPEAITGTVSAAADGRFEIRDAAGAVLSVTYDAGVVAASLFDTGDGTRLRDGAAVRITGQLDGGRIEAVSEIRPALNDLQPVAASSDELSAELAGPVTAPPDGGSVLKVAGQRVRLGADTTFSAGAAAADLQPGRQVRITGVLEPGEGDGRLLRAERVVVDPPVAVSLEDTVAGPVSAGPSATFATRIGVTVLVRPETVLEDDAGDGRLRVTDLGSGDAVEVDGYFDAEGRLVAVKLEREDGDAGCELEAPVRGSAVVGGARRYSVAGRPGLVVVDGGSDPVAATVPDGGFGEFEAAPSACTVLPDGADLDGRPVDAGFVADEVEQQDGPDDVDEADGEGGDDGDD